MLHTITRNLVILTTILASFAAQADYYRWGTTSYENSVYYAYSWQKVSPSNAHAFLYLGTAEITEEGGKKVVHLDNLTYVTHSSISNYRFGNHSAEKESAFNSSNLMRATGGQPYTIFLLGNQKSSESYPATGIKDNYLARSVTIYTGVSVHAMSTDTTPVPYADCATNHAFNDKTKCIENVTFVRNTEPVGKGGYMTGYTSGSAGSIPDPPASSVISAENARMYIYKGTATIDDRGVIDFSRLSYITNFIPASQGYFGNYKAEGVTKTILYENDLVSPEGGEAFSIFVVTTDDKPKKMPAQFYDYQTNNYVAIYNVTSQKKLTDDNWQYARLTIDKQIVPNDFNNGKHSTWFPMCFYNHMEYPAESKYATINIPKSYLVERYPGYSDEELMAASIATRTEGNKCTILDSYVLGLDPDDAQSIPTVLPGLAASGDKLQLNVGNVTVNEKANADVKYGLVSSSSPDFTNPTQEVDPQESPELEGALPASGVKYYRANLTVQGK